jgi:LCP family protein required for cell wall assembly
LPRTPQASAGLAALYSAILPGLGQMYASRWRRGLLLLVIPLAGLALFIALAAFVGPIAAAIVRRAVLFALLVVGGIYAFHVVVVADAFVGRARSHRPRVIDGALLAAVLLGLSLGYLALYRSSSAWATVVASVFQENTGRTLGTGSSSSDTAAPGWSGSERLNVLLLGVDEDKNTDTMMVLSLDPVGKTGVMLSIPRDTVVDIPGVGKDKINSAYLHGGGTPETGPQLVRRTVQQFLGIPIHSYVLVNYEAFTTTVNTLGGVVVDPRRPAADPAYPTDDEGIVTLWYGPGPQLMDGDRALRFARIRHDTNDFERARRQQLVVSAVRDRLGEAGLFRLPAIVQQVAPLVHTDFDPGNVMPLARTALAVKRSDIKSDVLVPCNAAESHCELTEVNEPSGYYLIPDVAKVRAFVASLLGSTASVTR